MILENEGMFVRGSVWENYVRVERRVDWELVGG